MHAQHLNSKLGILTSWDPNLVVKVEISEWTDSIGLNSLSSFASSTPI